VAMLEEATSVRLNILSAIQLTAEVWHSVKAYTFKNCFTKGGFLFDDVSHDVTINDDTCWMR
jgi:hypothetical protein